VRWSALALVFVASRAFAWPMPPPPPEPAPEPTPEPAPDQPPPPDQSPAPDKPPEPPASEPPPPAPPAAPPTVPTSATPEIKKGTASQKRIQAQAICDAHSPDCDWIATFSSLERASIRRSLKALGVELEPMPWGKTIGHVSVRNEDVFAESNWLQFFNHFHITTKSQAIEREMTFSEGQVYDPELIAESARRIKDPLFTSVVAIVPIKSSTEGQVDVLVVTRDIWSLRLNSKYTIQENSLTDLQISISENNFLGRRKTVAIAMVMDQGSIAVGPLYIDKNFLGKHLDFRFRVDRILTRQSLDTIVRDPTTGELTPVPTGDPKGIQDGGGLRTEGNDATVALSKPLWSLASKWGASTAFTYNNSISRSLFRTGIRSYDDPDTTAVDGLPREYRLKAWQASASATRQWGGTLKQQIQLGYNVSSIEPSLLPNFTMDPMLRADFVRDVFPHDEVISNPFIEYSFFLAKFKTVRNVDTFELAEDVRLGPNLTLGLAQSIKALGATANFTRPSITLGWTLPWGDDGFVRLSAGGQIRYQPSSEDSHDTIDNTATAQIRASTPTINFFRLIGQTHFETRWHDTQNTYYSVGSESSLRGYGIGQQIGDRRFVAQLEARSEPRALWVLRWGGVLFYDGGGAATSFGEMQMLHDVGFGLRTLVPQTSRDLFRFDLAFPLVEAEGVRAGVPRFTAGFDSYF
jgi:hypothetical protein